MLSRIVHSGFFRPTVYFLTGGLLGGYLLSFWKVQEPDRLSSVAENTVEEAPMALVSEKEPLNLDEAVVQLFDDELVPDSYSEQLALLSEIGASRPIGGLERLQFEALIRSLAEQDPMALYDWADRDRSMATPFRELIMSHALRVMAVREPSRALEIANTMNGYRHRNQIYQDLFTEMSMVYSSEELLRLTKQAAISPFAGWRYSDLAALLARENPDRVFDMIKRDFPTHEQETAYFTALKSIAEVDLVRAEQIAAGFEGTELATQLWKVFCIQALHDGDLPRARGLLADSPISSGRDNVLRTLLYERRLLTVEQSIELIETYASKKGQREMLGSIYADAVVDAPESLGSILQEHIEPQDRRNFLYSLAWRVRDADIFDEVYESLESAEDRSDFIDQYLSAGTYSDSSEMAKLFLKMQDSISHSTAAGRIANQLATYEPLAALEFAGQITDEAQQKAALKNVVSEWFGQDPEAAWAWLAEQEAANPDDLSFNQELQRRAIQTLGRDDPIGTLDYIESIEDSEFQRTVRKSVLPNLFQEDSTKAIEYIESVTPPEELDDAYGTVAHKIRHSTPDLAIQAALRISDDSVSGALCRQILQDWQNNRSASFVAEQLDAMDISEAQRTRLMESL